MNLEDINIGVNFIAKGLVHVDNQFNGDDVQWSNYAHSSRRGDANPSPSSLDPARYEKLFIAADGRVYFMAVGFTRMMYRPPTVRSCLSGLHNITIGILSSMCRSTSDGIVSISIIFATCSRRAVRKWRRRHWSRTGGYLVTRIMSSRSPAHSIRRGLGRQIGFK